MKLKLKFCFVKQNSTLMGTGRELTKQKKKKTAFLRLLLLVWFVIFLLLFFLINHFPFYPIMEFSKLKMGEKKSNLDGGRKRANQAIQRNTADGRNV